MLHGVFPHPPSLQATLRELEQHDLQVSAYLVKVQQQMLLQQYCKIEVVCLVQYCMVSSPSLQATMRELEQHDPQAAASLIKVQQQQMSKQQFQELLQLEGLPSNCSREQYMQYSIEQLLGVGGAGWAMEAVGKGFWSAVEKEVSICRG